MLEWSTGVLVFILGVVAAMVLQAVLKEPIYRVLGKILGGVGPRPKRHIRGIWECCYRYESKGVVHFEQQLMLLRHFGPFVSGTNLAEQQHAHRVQGRIRNGSAFTGQWENVGEGEVWHGGFQFLISTKGEEMWGKWIGFDSRQQVQSGPWHWKLVSRDVSRRSRERAKRDWKTNDTLRDACRPEADRFRDILALYATAWTDQDPSLLPQIFTRDAVYSERAFVRPLEGLEQIGNYWRTKVVNSQHNIEFELRWVIADEDVGVAEWDVEFDDLADGVRKQLREVAIVQFRDNKISHLREYWWSKRRDA